MSPFEYYFSIINIILLIIIFIWSYFINFNYNKNSNEIKKIKEEVEKIKDEIRSEEQFYKSIVTNLSEYLNLINKNKKQVIKNSAPISNPPQIIKKEEKKEIVLAEKKSSFLEKIKNFAGKCEKILNPKKKEEVKEVKKIISPTPTPIPTVNKGEGKKSHSFSNKDTENWKKK